MSPWVPEGFFRGEAAIVSGQAAIEIVANFLTFAATKKPSGTHGTGILTRDLKVNFVLITLL